VHHSDMVSRSDHGHGCVGAECDGYRRLADDEAEGITYLNSTPAVRGVLELCKGPNSVADHDAC
jgi:hypothetical protein